MQTSLVLSEVFGHVVAACHGQQGQGMGAFPKLASQTSDYISEKLYAYKNREQVGDVINYVGTSEYVE